MKILTVVGARPQFVKAATVSRQITQTKHITEYIVHTGQHYDENMSGVFFKELGIPKPNVNLKIGSGLHGKQTAQMLIGIEREIIQQKPSCILVYGDTNSTIAGALAAAKLNIPICHVEAGLRSFNKKMPEEINRILTDHSSDILFTPTEIASAQLLKEGISEDKIVQSGDVMFDSSLYYGSLTKNSNSIGSQLELCNTDYILTTIHRAENTDEEQKLIRIIKELAALSESYRVIFPAHPRTKLKIQQLGLNKSKIEFINPVGYLDMVFLEQNSKAIITDSGGVQKEAYFYNKPCITVRTETEWVELIHSGWNYLFPPIPENTHSLKSCIMDQIDKVATLTNNKLYGKGNAAQIIVKTIVERI